VLVVGVVFAWHHVGELVGVVFAWHHVGEHFVGAFHHDAAVVVNGRTPAGEVVHTVWHSARGHTVLLWPFGSSSPLHKVYTCSGHKWLVGNL